MGTLVTVADNLASTAISQTGASADAFGRSAFNRYYYASFLTTRDLLLQVDRSWVKTSHANIPEILEITLIKKVRLSVKNQISKQLINTSRGFNLQSQVTSAASDIASILKIAYDLRTIADYEPEVPVVFSTTHFELGTHTNTEAKKWFTRVEQKKGMLIKSLKELGLV